MQPRHTTGDGQDGTIGVLKPQITADEKTHIWSYTRSPPGSIIPSHYLQTLSSLVLCVPFELAAARATAPSLQPLVSLLQASSIASPFTGFLTGIITP
jgi:hypothetical protein